MPNSTELEMYLHKMLTQGTEIIFKDDFEEGNILHIEDGVFVYMDYTDEIEKERFFDIYSESNFTLGESKC